MATNTWDLGKTRGGRLSRGRHADSPTEIPAKGWKDTLLRVKKQISEDKLSMVAAAMAYYALLAFIPALTSLVLMYAWFSDPAEISQHLDAVSRILPGEITNTIKEQLTALSGKHSNTTLGLSAISALLFSTWSASKGANALTEGLNVVYDQENNRGFIKSTLMALGLTLLGTLMGIVAIGVVVGYPAIIKLFNFPKTIETIAGVGSWVLLLGLFSLFLSFAYRYCPDRDKAKWKWVSWGAVVASVLWALVSAGFSFYAAEFGNFNKSYGSMGAIIILMMWFYLSSFVILVGGELNAELEHQTMKDTTKGPQKPMGQRGAEMADTVGPQQGK